MRNDLLSNIVRLFLQGKMPRVVEMDIRIEGAQVVARGRGDIATFDRAIVAYRASGLLP